MFSGRIVVEHWLKIGSVGKANREKNTARNLDSGSRESGSFQA